MVEGKGTPLDTRTLDEIADNWPAQATQEMVATDARETIDGLLDELKQTIAERLSAGDMADFVAGRVAIMATLRMERKGKVPES
jgi:hypothetical protein